MPYSADKPTRARSSEELRAAIPGWGADTPAVQIAEHAVRTRYGITGIDDVRPTAVTSSGVGQDVVVSTASGLVHVHVAPAPEAERRTTCRSLTSTVPDHGIVTFSESAFDAAPTC